MAICPEPGCPKVRPCPIHGGTHTGWSSNRNRAAQQRFRDQVLANAGYRCEGHDGQARCPVMGPRNLVAHHVNGLSSYDPREGQALCNAHHRAVDSKAR